MERDKEHLEERDRELALRSQVKLFFMGEHGSAFKKQ
jgi:hypothetical protein